MRSFLMAHSATSESAEKITPSLCPEWILSTNGTKFGKKRIEDSAFFTFYILFILYSMYNLYEPVQYVEIEGYYAEVQCSIFYTTNCIQSTYFLDLTSH